MKGTIFVLSLIAYLPISAVVSADQNTVNQLLNDYMQQGAIKSNAKAGKELWVKGFKRNDDGSLRRCSTCHTNDLTQTGKHLRTGKEIKPMSPSVNLKRLSSRKKVEKWFKRNCKWTIGRVCTPQEKADFLVYINTSTHLKF